MNWYPWVVAVHALASFGFILAHGVSAFVAFRLRSERRPDHVATLLGLSSSAMMPMYSSLLLLLVAGIAAGFMGSWWGHAWVWIAIGVLLATATAMYLVGTRYYIEVRHAVGILAPQDGKDAPAPAVLDAAELDALLTSSRPAWLAAIGGIGLAVLVWLMVAKP